MNNKAVAILKFLEFSQKLKSQERTIKLSDNRHESSADHSWHLAIMALAIAPHLKKKIDLLKTLKMVLVHDLVEAEIGGESGQEIFDLWVEFEEDTTLEAKFVRAIDSLEANHQSVMYDVAYWDDWFYPIALTKADKHCEHEEILSALNNQITERMKNEFKKAGIEVA